MLSRIHAPSCHAPSAPCVGTAVTRRSLLPRRMVSARGSQPLSCRTWRTCSVEVILASPMVRIRSPSFRPQSRAGQGPSSDRPTTSAPSAKSLMPTALPSGITVRASGAAQTCWKQRDRVNTRASSLAVLLRRLPAGCVSRSSYKRLTPLWNCRRRQRYFVPERGEAYGVNSGRIGRAAPEIFSVSCCPC